MCIEQCRPLKNYYYNANSMFHFHSLYGGFTSECVLINILVTMSLLVSYHSLPMRIRANVKLCQQSVNIFFADRIDG